MLYLVLITLPHAEKNPLKNMLESIFHTHTISVTSVYAYALKTKTQGGLAITLEEESIDISFVAEGKVLLNVFIPDSYVQLEEKIMAALDTDAKTVQNILRSRASKSIPMSNTLRHVWPDLSADVQKKVDDIVAEHYKGILKYVYTLLDQVKTEHAFKAEDVQVCALNELIMGVYGLALADLIKDDQYIKEMLHLDDNHVYIDYLF